MRKPSASTWPSRPEGGDEALSATPNITSLGRDCSCRSNLADARQHRFAEQLDLGHHRVGIAPSGIGQRQVEDADPDLVARLFDLLDHAVRAAAEADRQDAADIGRALLAADIALVLLDQRAAQSGADRERRLRL